MTVVAGVGPDGKGHAAVHLAGRVAATSGESVRLCCVVLDAWESRTLVRGTDVEWRRHLEGLAAQSLAEASQLLPPEVDVETTVRVARSVPRALLAEASACGATLLCLGSSDDALRGHLSFGSVSGRLVHSADVPVAIAPRSFWSQHGDVVERIVLTLSADPTEGAVETTVALARRFGASVSLVTFGARRLPGFADGGGRQADLEVFEAWRDDVAARHAEVTERLTEAGVAVGESTLAVAESWSRAVERMHWLEGDLLVVGSGREGLLARVFLGSTAQRILSRVPVPVVVAPRE